MQLSTCKSNSQVEKDKSKGTRQAKEAPACALRKHRHWTQGDGATCHGGGAAAAPPKYELRKAPLTGNKSEHDVTGPQIMQ